MKLKTLSCASFVYQRFSVSVLFSTLFLCALFARVIFSLLAPTQYQSFGDTAEYIETAKRLCSNGAYPFEHIALPTFRAPGFPIFLALFSNCFSWPLWAINVSLIILDSLSCVLAAGIVYLVSAENKRIRAILCGLAFAGYPLFIQASVAVQSETLTLFALLACIILLVKSEQQADSNIRLSGYAICSGLFLAITILSRPSSLALVFPLCVGFLLAPSVLKKGISCALVSMSFVVGSWSYYATIHTGKLTLVNDSFCYSFYRGTKLELIDVYTAKDTEAFRVASEKSEAAVRAAEAITPNNQWCSAGMQEFIKDPEAQTRLALMKLGAFFRPWPHQAAHSGWIVWIVGGIVLLGYAGFLLLLFQKETSKPVYSIKFLALMSIILIALLHVPHQVSNRYRVPYVDPIVLLLGFTYLRGRITSKVPG